MAAGVNDLICIATEERGFSTCQTFHLENLSEGYYGAAPSKAVSVPIC